MRTTRMCFGGKSVLWLVAALVLTPAVSADEKKLPSAEQILDKSVEALGGKAAMEKLHSRVIKGTFEIAGMGIKGPLELYQKAPQKMYLEIDLGATGKTSSGTDGNTVWELTTLMGGRVLEGEERAMVLRDAMFNAELNWRKLYPKVECAGREEIDGKPCYKLVLTPEDGGPLIVYYDAKSFLQVRIEFTAKTALGSVPVTVTPSDYRRVDDVLIARKIIQKIAIGNQTQVFTYERIEHNVDIPDERFAPPEAVQALLDQAKEKEKKSDSDRK
jgi:outer membrane lipoprotein-sorting protein